MPDKETYCTKPADCTSWNKELYCMTMKIEDWPDNPGDTELYALDYYIALNYHESP